MNKSKITINQIIVYCQLKTNSCVSRFSFLVLLLSFYIFNSTFCIAEVRYVSTTGSSTPPYITWETAADSIQKAINICLPGDTIIVANGVYYENLVIDSALTLIGSSMDSTVIDGRGLGDYTILNNEPLSIENFNIYGKGENTNGTRCIQFYDFLEIKNCRTSQTELSLGSVLSDIIADNILMNDIKGGFSLFGNGNNYISNCSVILENQNSIGVGIGFSPNGTYHITNNIILFTGTANINEIGIYVGGPRQIYINNNLISGFRTNISIDDPAEPTYIFNNILAYSKSISIDLSGDYLFVNNVVLSRNRKGIRGDWLVTSDYNLFWDNLLEDLEGVSYGDSDMVADPMFVKDTLPNPQIDFNYHLQAFSPGIDGGDPNIFDVDSTRSDIGLYGGPFGESYTYQDLAPRQPVNLSAVQDTNQILLKWNRNSEADTSHFNVYRDTVPAFTIDSTKLIASPTDTFFVQYPPYESSQYVYKITCVDNQGNESLPSEEVVIKPVSVDEYPQIVNNYYLYQNYPNPFNPSTIIGYKLKERGYVKLMVYDIKGELISVLVNEEQESGYYEVEFNFKSQISNLKSNLASGIYLYRIEVIGEGRIPVYSDMKKMVLIK